MKSDCCALAIVSTVLAAGAALAVALAPWSAPPLQRFSLADGAQTRVSFARSSSVAAAPLWRSTGVVALSPPVARVLRVLAGNATELLCAAGVAVCPVRLPATLIVDVPAGSTVAPVSVSVASSRQLTLYWSTLAVPLLGGAAAVGLPGALLLALCGGRRRALPSSSTHDGEETAPLLLSQHP